MAKMTLLGGTTSYIATVFIQDSTSTAGAGKTGLTYTSITAYYVRPGNVATSITLATQTPTGAYSSGGFCEVDATNMPGVYRIDIPNIVLSAGAKSATVLIKGSGIAPVPLEFELTATDNQSATFQADQLLKRDMSAVSGESARSPLNALRLLRNKWSFPAGVLTVCKEDDTTTAWTGTSTTDASAAPVTGIDPA